MIVSIINAIFTIFQIMLLARIIISWIRVSPYDRTWGPIVNFIYEFTEPFLAPVRRILPPTGMFDFSVLIVWFLASFLRTFLISLFV